ncbi:MAG: transporter substrate-binding protein [Paenibacillus sp.]|nr:transporter substrate-binding protein [Paenibacillus sp.]
MKTKPTNEQFRQELECMVRTLREEIADGTYRPGQLLPSEPAQAARFGMSNKSVRKGLDILVDEGLIEKIPRVGSRVKAARPPVSLTLGYYGKDLHNMDLAGLLADFQRRYSWITVTARPHSEQKSVETSAEWADHFDLIMLNNEHFGYMAESGRHSLLRPLAAKSGVFPFLTRPFMQDGQLYVRPILYSPVVLCYNKRHFRDEGMPEPDGSWTWHDLVRSAVRLTNGSGRFGFCFYIANINRWPIFLLQSGEVFVREDGAVRNIRHSGLLSALKLCKSIIRNGDMFPLFISENDGDIIRMFLEGKLSMVLNTYMGMNEWKHADLEYDVSPIPYIGQPITLAIAEGVGINNRTAHPEEAELLADYLSSSRAQSHIRDHTFSLPTLQSVSDGPAPKGLRVPDRYMMYREMMFSYRTHGDLNIPISAYKKLSYQIKAYWANLIDEDELCDRICRELSVP